MAKPKQSRHSQVQQSPEQRQTAAEKLKAVRDISRGKSGERGGGPTKDSGERPRPQKINSEPAPRGEPTPAGAAQLDVDKEAVHSAHMLPAQESTYKWVTGILVGFFIGVVLLEMGWLWTTAHDVTRNSTKIEGIEETLKDLKQRIHELPRSREQ